jgi:hypothetical protein
MKVYQLPEHLQDVASLGLASGELPRLLFSVHKVVRPLPHLEIP